MGLASETADALARRGKCAGRVTGTAWRANLGYWKSRLLVALKETPATGAGEFNVGDDAGEECDARNLSESAVHRYAQL